MEKDKTTNNVQNGNKPQQLLQNAKRRLSQKGRQKKEKTNQRENHETTIKGRK